LPDGTSKIFFVAGLDTNFEKLPVGQINCATERYRRSLPERKSSKSRAKINRTAKRFARAAGIQAQLAVSFQKQTRCPRHSQSDVVAAQQRNGAMGHEETSIVRLNVMQLSSMGPQ
jgi:hypothetical protein